MYNIFPILNKHLKFISETAEEYVFRCPYCGDSKNPSHGHLYVSKTSPVFHCKKCNAGVGKTINDLLEFLKEERIDFKDFSIKKEVGYANNIINENTQVDKRIFNTWVNYISLRLNVPRDEVYKNMWKLSIVKSVDTLPVSKTLAESFKKGKVIAFYTYNRTKIIARRLFKSELISRYLNTRISNAKVLDMYAIVEKNANIDKIVIAEGIFDILGLYFKLKHKYGKNTLWVAVLGNTYTKGVEFANINFNLKSPSIDFYIDNDSYMWYNIKKMKKAMNKMPMRYSMFINVMGKDFGGKTMMIQKVDNVL